MSVQVGSASRRGLYGESPDRIDLATPVQAERGSRIRYTEGEPVHGEACDRPGLYAPRRFTAALHRDLPARRLIWSFIRMS